MKTIIPPYLQKGDTIGIVAPAGYMPFDRMEACIEILDSWGYNVKLGSTTHSESTNYFSGSDEERRRDLQEMIDDDHVQAILCARGGYGFSRIIDELDFDRLKKHPKWIIGFSDVTLLHCHLLSNYKIASLHAPMAAAFRDGLENNLYLASFRDAIEGKPAQYRVAPHPFNRLGFSEAQLVGGNLTMLLHTLGTESEPKTKNRILFIEDIGEHLYSIDRMMIQLKRSGKLDKLEGLIVGGFTEMKDTQRPFGRTVQEIIYEHVKDYDFPVCFDFPVSHDRENLALGVGIEYQLMITAEEVILRTVSSDYAEA